jgi:2,3-bisphosphoglycerate-independent phosphoglycerate mutase
MTTTPPKPVLLCILDGWGNGPNTPDNAIARAHTPNWDRFIATRPQSALKTSGLDVGLPEGQMGNSEVGHMNIGGGRVVMQDLPRIDQATHDGTLAENPVLQKLITQLKSTGGVCHIAGLLSDGGVHAHNAHILALTQIVVNAGIEVKLHAFLDGRDTPPGSAPHFVKSYEDDLAESGISAMASIATVCGRYYAMDRDNRWDRVEKAYNTMILGDAPREKNALTAIEKSYAAGKQDEFLLPCVIGDYQGANDGDALLFANFRADRARQIATALGVKVFEQFSRKKIIRWTALASMVEYSKSISAFMPVLFPPETLEKMLGDVVAAAGKKQLRIAETEKYAHVTFFFNGGREEVFEGEDRILVPSPNVATYDLQPEMSSTELTDKLVAAIDSGKYDLIVVNYANTDMVGHTGSLEAATKAVEAVDRCLGRVEQAILRAGGAMFITADHGNAEQMLDPDTKKPHTAHTTNPVPFIYIGDKVPIAGLNDGRLSDIAPTLLTLLRLHIPKDMTGKPLLTMEAQKKTVLI